MCHLVLAWLMKWINPAGNVRVEKILTNTNVCRQFMCRNKLNTFHPVDWAMTCGNNALYPFHIVVYLEHVEN